MPWRPLAGTGSVHTFTVMRRPGNPAMADQTPYVIALVDLEEGIRMTTNVVGVAPERVHCGQPVVVDWSVTLSDGRRLPVFAPAAT